MMKQVITKIRKIIIARGNLLQLLMKTDFSKLGLEIACNNGWLHQNDLHRIGTALSKNGYGEYLLSLIKEKS